MRHSIIAFLVLLTSCAALAQSKNPNSDSLVARLSYDRTSVVWQEKDGPSKVCLALYRSGRYQLLIDTVKGTQSLQGTLSRDQLMRIQRMVKDLDFQSSGVSTVLQGSESFEAEVDRSGKTQRYIWVDPDHRRPFPPSAMSLAHWLRNFKSQGASPLSVGEFNEQQICPSDEPLQPLSAALPRESGVDSCSRH
jgi:hypothetical protein